jgi:hypothetical protein
MSSVPFVVARLSGSTLLRRTAKRQIDSRPELFGDDFYDDV